MKYYFDNAATTPLRPEVIASIAEVLTEDYGNPSSTHAFGRKARARIETARKSVARLLGAQAQEIIFTSCGTESNNTVLQTAFRDLSIKRIISSPIEHHAVLHVLDDLKLKGCTIDYVQIDSQGQVELSHLEELLSASDEKTLVSLMHINNEIGSILDLYAAGSLCREYGALFHTDAVQGVGHYSYDLNNTPVDFLTASAHKFHGPKGIGFTYIRNKENLHGLLLGGSQERGLRAGTESVHNIVGLQVALEICMERLEEERNYVRELKSFFVNQLRQHFPEIHFNGCCDDMERATYTLVNCCLPLSEAQAQMLEFQLDLKGVACSKGSACQSGSGGGSHVIQHLYPENPPSSAIRFSFSPLNTVEEVESLVDILCEISLKPS
ncbi:MAG: cysteine desulfurase family protein [Flavobacteriaceae bacterium]